MSMAAKRRTPFQRERDLRDTAALYLRGLLQWEIAKRLNVSRQQVSYDLKILQRRWQESALADFDAKKAAELAKMEEVERTYWAAWERSCQPREITTQEKTQGRGGQGDEGRFKAGLRKEARDGNPEFLRGVERCIEMRCKITGAFAAAKVAPTTPNGKEEWHANESETKAVLCAAFSRLGLAVGQAGVAGTTDDPGQALDPSGVAPAAGGDEPGSMADECPAEPASADPAAVFSSGG
jgi:hypothetical protein